jgi:hypothetical protein
MVKNSVTSVQSLADLFDLLGKSQPGDKHVNLYRGHSDQAHTLQPSIFRKKEHRRVERNILRELIAIRIPPRGAAFLDRFISPRLM